MMGTTNIAFDIGDQDIDPRQDLRRLFLSSPPGAGLLPELLRRVHYRDPETDK